MFIIIYISIYIFTLLKIISNYAKTNIKHKKYLKRFINSPYILLKNNMN
jgi:hypothetical protein